MVRSKLARALTDDLNKKIKLAETKKKEVLSYSNKIKKLWASGQISDSKYQNLIEKEVDGKTIKEWTKQYDSYIDYYKEEIKEQKSKEFSKKLIIASIIFALILTLPLLALNGKFSLVGYAVSDSEGEAPSENIDNSDAVQETQGEITTETTLADEVTTDNVPSETTTETPAEIPTETTNETETSPETNTTEEVPTNETTVPTNETIESTNETTTQEETTVNETVTNETIPDETTTTEEPATEPIIPSEINLTGSPQLIKNIPDIRFKLGGFYVINLSSYFSNANEFYFLQVEGVSTTISGDLVLFRAENSFIGKQTTGILATNEQGSTKSNLFSITVLGTSQSLEETPSEESPIIENETLEENLTIKNETVLETNLTNRTLIENQTILETNLTNVTETNANASITTTQFRPKLGQPVKWKKEITLDAVGTFNVTIPADAQITSITKSNETTNQVIEGTQSNEILNETDSTITATSTVEEIPFTITGNIVRAGNFQSENLFVRALRGLKNLFFKIFGAITGNVISENVVGEDKIIEINDTATNYEINYETEAPQAFEENTANGKTITISGPDALNYTNVLAFTDLGKEIEPNTAKLYHIVDGARIETNITQFDTNGDNLIDYIEWNVPHLSNQTYELIIEITKAQHLDENRIEISDIYDEVYQLDNNWSEEISDGHYVRITFERNLTNNNDITIYPRIISGNPSVEVYEVDGTEIIAEFSSLNENEYNKVILSGLISESQDTFDLRIVGGSVEFDHIIDPVSSAFADGGSTLLSTTTPTTLTSVATTSPSGTNIVIASVQISSNNSGLKNVVAGDLKLNVEGGANLASNEYTIALVNKVPSHNAYTLISTHSGSGNDAYNVTGLSSANYVFGESKIAVIYGVTNYLLNDSASMTIATTESVIANLNTTFPAGDNIILASVQIDNGATVQNITAGDIHIEDSAGNVLSSNEFRIHIGANAPFDIASILLIAKDTGASANENYTVTMLSAQAAVAEAKAIVFQAPDSAFVDGGSVAVGTADTTLASLGTTFAAGQELVVIGATQFEDTDIVIEGISATNLILKEDAANRSSNEYTVATLQAFNLPGDGTIHPLLWRNSSIAASPMYNVSAGAGATSLNGEAKIIAIRMYVNPPVATLGTNPVNTYNSTSSSVTFDFKASDNSDVDYVSLYGNWSGTWAANYSNTTQYINDTWVNITVTGIPDGYYTWGIFTNDTSGNVNWSSNRTFSVSLSPQLIYVSPTESNATTLTNINYTLINVSINESSLIETIFDFNNVNYSIFNQSIVAYYNFENLSSLGENDTHVVDLSGWGNNGTVVGGNVTIASGKYGRAMQFDGADDYVGVPNNPSINFSNTQPFTIGLWFNAKQSNIRYMILKNSNYGIQWKGTATPLNYYNGNDFTGTKTSWNLDEWYHVVIIDNGSNYCYAYVNGVLDFSDSCTPNRFGTSNLEFGRSGGAYFNGSVDEVIILNRSLSASEVRQLYMSTLQKVDPDTYYFFANMTQNPANGNSLVTNAFHTHQVFAKDSNGGANQTERRYINFTDNVRPQFSAMSVSPINNTNYTYPNQVTFNATINNTNNTAWLNINGVNYSVTNFSNGFFNITLPLSANTSGHNYYWIAHGSGDSRNLNNSETLTYYIRKLKNPDETEILTDTNNWMMRQFYPNGFADTIAVSESNGGDADVNYSIWRNDTYAGDHISGATISEAGVWSFSLNRTEGTNYSLHNLIYSNTKEIIKIAPAISVWLDGGLGNITVPQGQTIALNCSVSPDIADAAMRLEMWENSTPSSFTLINQGTGVQSIINASYSPLATGIVTILCNNTATTNYTAATDHNYVNVTVAATPPQLIYVSPTEANATTVMANYTAINVSINDTSLIETIFDFNNVNYSMFNQSMVAYYNFENLSSLGENDTHVVDLSGWGNNGTVSGGNTTTASGKYGRAMQFDGVNDFVNISDSSSLDVGNKVTFSAWVYPTSFADHGYHTVMAKGYAGAFWFGFYQTGGRIQLWVAGAEHQSTGAVQLNQWSLITATWDGSTINYYINGVYDSQNTGVTGAAVTNNLPLYIGADREGGTNPEYIFTGSIDEVAIFNRSLSASEVRQLYMSTLQKVDSDTYYFYANETMNPADGSSLATSAFHTHQVFAKDSAGDANLTVRRYVNLSKNLPTIPTVEAISAQNPIESSVKTITFKFNVTDADGVGDINGSSATANFTYTGEPNRYNTSCLWITNYTGVNTAQFQCAVNMQYYDKAASWAINVSAKDNEGSFISNTSTTFTYNSLPAMVISPEALNWASLNALSTNAGSDNNPVLVNNTGNSDGLSVKVKGYNLLGVDRPSEMVFAANASVGTSTPGCDSTAMVNASATTVTGATLNRRTDASAAAGQEQIFFCIEAVPSSVNPQTYSSSAYGTWTVEVFFAPLVAVRRKKKSKKQKDLIKTIDLLLETIRIRNNLSNIETINLLAKIIRKEKYGVEDKIIESVEEILNELEKTFSFSKKQVLELLINTLGKRYNIGKEDLKRLKETTLGSISISVFSSKLGGLESIVKYMRENLEMNFNEIAEKLNRDYRTIWTAYNQAKKKKIEIKLSEKDDLTIPTSIFQNRKLTIFEAIVVYLKEKEMRYNRIAELLNRNQRNVWTMYSRAIKK